MRLRGTRLTAISRGSRGGYWTPALLNTSLWLDAADASTVTLNGATVSQWSDKSGNGRHATQATAAAQPGYNASGINGKPVLTFNGASSDWMNTGTLNVAMQNDYTVLAALSTTNTSTGSFWYLVPGFLGGERGGVGADHGLGFNGLRPITGVGGPADAMLQATNSVTSGMPAIPYWDRTSSTGTCRWYLDGAANGQGTGETGARTYNNGMALGSMWENGGGQWLSFVVGEIVVVSSVLSDSNRQRIEGYLAHKWWGSGAANTLPADHPFKNVPPTV